jgi:ketosteroid isomerase-like protein
MAKEEEEEGENISTVKQLYDAFKRRDISSLLDMFTDDAVIHGPAPAGVVPWGGVHDGRKGAAKFFMAVGESLEPQQFELREYIAQGNKVVVLGYQRGKARPTGRPYEIEFVHLWSLRDGRCIEFRVFNDTAALVEALRRIEESSQWCYFHLNAYRACSKSWSLYDSSMQQLSVYLRAGIVP